MKILYLEDDIDLNETITEYLQDKEFEIVSVFDGEEALNLIYSQNFDLFILDVQVPNIDGFELLKTLRNANINTPTIFTTSRNSIEDLSIGYEIGADDYLKKPFALKELYFRIQALLKRNYNLNENIIKIDENITFDLNTNLLKNNENTFNLNPKETLLLKLLIKKRNSYVSFEEIYENVWTFDENHSVESLRTYIKNLRKYIGKEKIVTIKKQGYMLV